MKISLLHILTPLIFLLLINEPLLATENTQGFSELPEIGKVTMIDLGAKKCIPCKMMAPILVKMEKIYQGKAVVAFIDV